MSLQSKQRYLALYLSNQNTEHHNTISGYLIVSNTAYHYNTLAGYLKVSNTTYHHNTLSGYLTVAKP